MTLNMCWDGVLVEVPAPETKTKSGLIIPESANQSLGADSCIGTIAAVGENVDERFKVGTEIVYFNSDVTPIKINGHDYVILRHQDDIIGIATKNESDK